jgi:hypothetical protein
MTFRRLTVYTTYKDLWNEDSKISEYHILEIEI